MFWVPPWHSPGASASGRANTWRRGRGLSRIDAEKIQAATLETAISQMRNEWLAPAKAKPGETLASIGFGWLSLAFSDLRGWLLLAFPSPSGWLSLAFPAPNLGFSWLYRPRCVGRLLAQDRWRPTDAARALHDVNKCKHPSAARMRTKPSGAAAHLRRTSVHRPRHRGPCVSPRPRSAGQSRAALFHVLFLKSRPATRN